MRLQVTILQPPPLAVFSKRRRARVALGVGALVYSLLTLALAYASERSFQLRDPAYGDKEARLQDCERKAPAGAFEVVMLGTSRTGFAFHGNRIESQLATPDRPLIAFNFGVPATGPVTHRLYLERLLADGHRPNLLLLEVLPSSLSIFSDGPREQKFITGDRMRRREVDAVIAYGFPPAPVETAWRQSLLNPWHALRFQVIGRLANGWLPWQYRQDSGRVSDNRGWLNPMATTVEPARQREAFARTSGEYGPVLANMTPGGGSGQAFEDLLELAKRHDIPVKLVTMPESIGFRALYHPHVRGRVDSYLLDISRRHGVEWIDARDWLEESMFYDGHHMLRHGAEAFSDRLARDVIAPTLAK